MLGFNETIGDLAIAEADGAIYAPVEQTISIQDTGIGGWRYPNINPPSDFMANNWIAPVGQIEFVFCNDGALTTATDSYGDTLNATFDYFLSGLNKAIRVSHNTIYTLGRDGIYRSTDSGASFSSFQTFNNPRATGTAGAIMQTGIYRFTNGDGDDCLTGMYSNNTGNALSGWIYNLTQASYTETTYLALAANTGGIRGEVFLDDVLIWQQRDNRPIFWCPHSRQILIGDAGQDDASSSVRREVYDGYVDFCIGADGKLYRTFYDQYAPRVCVLEGDCWLPFSFRFVSTGNNSANSHQTNWSMPVLLLDEKTKAMVLFGHDDAGSTTQMGFSAWVIPYPYFDQDPVDLTSQMLPAGLISANRSGSFPTSTYYLKIRKVIDTVKGGIALYFGWGTSQTGTLDGYIYRGVGHEISYFGETELVNGFFLPSTLTGGGDRFFTTGTKYIHLLERDNAENSSGRETITFVAYGGGTLDFRLIAGSNNQRPDLTNKTYLTLANPSSGTLSGSDRINGVTADGTTEHTVEWDFDADGYSYNASGLVPLIAEIP